MTLEIWNAGKCAKNAWLITSEVRENMKKAKKRKMTLDVMMNLKVAGKRKITLNVMTNLKVAGKMTKAVVASIAKSIAIAAAETGSAKKSAICAWKSSTEVKMSLKEVGMRKTTLDGMNPKEAGKRTKAVVAAGVVAEDVMVEDVMVEDVKAADVVAATDLNYETSTIDNKFQLTWLSQF